MQFSSKNLVRRCERESRHPNYRDSKPDIHQDTREFTTNTFYLRFYVSDLQSTYELQRSQIRAPNEKLMERSLSGWSRFRVYIGIPAAVSERINFFRLHWTPSWIQQSRQCKSWQLGPRLEAKCHSQTTKYARIDLREYHTIETN